jgi:hypothetical protein
LSSDLKEEDAFEKVHLSLSSGLPNEVDFAINAILVRSADLRRPFMLTPNRMTMMESLVAAVGIFADRTSDRLTVALFSSSKNKVNVFLCLRRSRTLYWTL